MVAAENDNEVVVAVVVAPKLNCGATVVLAKLNSGGAVVAVEIVEVIAAIVEGVKVKLMAGLVVFASPAAPNWKPGESKGNSDKLS